MVSLSEPHKTLLELCQDDHTGLWFAIGPIQDFYRGDDSETIRARTLEVLHDLLKGGLIEAGFPTPDGRGFESWGLAPDEAIKKIDREWRELGREPSLGDIVWFNSTPAGDKLLSQLRSS